jgi:hypothetical protein
MDKTEQLRLAKQLQKNKLLWGLFDTLELSIHEDWSQSSSVEMRERLWLRLSTLNNFREELHEQVRRLAGDSTDGDGRDA